MTKFEREVMEKLDRIIKLLEKSEGPWGPAYTYPAANIDVPDYWPHEWEHAGSTDATK